MKKLSRRELMMVAGAGLAGATVASAFPEAGKKLYAYVSSWTDGPAGAGRGGGLGELTVNMKDGSLTLVSKTGAEFDNLNGGNICIASKVVFCMPQMKEITSTANAARVAVYRLRYRPQRRLADTLEYTAVYGR